MDISVFLEQYYQACRLPVSCFSGKDLLARNAQDIQDFNLPMILWNCLPSELPPAWYCATPEHMYLGGINCVKTGQCLLIGPVLFHNCSSRQAEQILSRLGRAHKDLSVLLRYFEQFASCNVSSLKAHISLLYSIFNGEVCSAEHIEFQWKSLFAAAPEHIYEIEEGLDTTLLEQHLLSCIRHGKTEETERFINEHILFSDTFHGFHNQASTSQLRNYILGANMIASRTAMDSGVNCDLINTMSGHYIEEISKSSTATDFAMVFADMFKSYTSQVAKLRQLASGSPLSHKIDSFIQSHLYEKLSPARIAEHLNMNCSYLCTHFKQTTGKTISAYIQECKIQEAIHLLECGNLSSPAISELLCFSSQSYFCAVFKKITGMTPQEYKKKFLTPAGSDV